MIKVDLITGFLGVGKTTFIKRYARHLMAQGLKVGIIENDYGAINVDRMLLQELLGEQCEIETVAGACDYDCHKRRFKTKLIAMGMGGYDRVLIEPSGVYDVEEFFDVLYEEPLDRWYEIGSVIAIVDAGLEEELSEEAEYLLACQTAKAGSVLLSRCDMVPKECVAQTVAHLDRAMERFHCKRRFGAEVITKPWAELTEANLTTIQNSGHTRADYVKLSIGEKNGFSSLYYMNLSLSLEEIRRRAADVLQDAACGRVFRIKGFARGEDGGWVELNATRENFSMKPISEGQEVLIVIGENLSREVVNAHWK